MKTIDLGIADELPPVDWSATVERIADGSPPAPDGPPPWHVYRIEPRTATVVLGVEPGGLTRFTF